MMKKFLATAAVLLMMSAQVEAAAVVGQDDWEDLTEQEELSVDKPLEVHGKIKLERKIFSGTKDYPTTFGETKNIAEAQLDWRLRFAPRWYIKGRLQGDRIWHKHSDRENKLSFKQLYAEGKIGVVTLRGGKIPIFDALNLTNGGLVIDSEITGGQVRIPVGDWKIYLSGGVIRNDDYDLTRTTTIFRTDSTYLSLQAEGNLNENFSVAAGVHNMHNTAGGLSLPSGAPYSPGGKGFFESGTEKNNTVFTVGFDYKFNQQWTLGGIYAAGTAEITKQAQQNSRESTDEEKSYSVQLTFGHPENKSAGNFSAWLAYRQAGRVGSYRPAYKGVGFGERGAEVGIRYQALKELAFELIYFDGKKVSRLSPPVPDKGNPKIHKWYLGAEYSF